MLVISYGQTIHIVFNTLDATGNPVSPDTAFVINDFVLLRHTGSNLVSDGGVWPGFTYQETPGMPGNHHLTIDTSLDPPLTPGFFVEGGNYSVEFFTMKTVAGRSINGRSILNSFFRIEKSSGVIPPPPAGDPDVVNAYLYVQTETGAKEGINCEAVLVDKPTGTGTGHAPDQVEFVTGPDGLFQFLAWRGGSYRLTLAGSTDLVTIPADADDPYPLPNQMAGYPCS